MVETSTVSGVTRNKGIDRMAFAKEISLRQVAYEIWEDLGQEGRAELETVVIDYFNNPSAQARQETAKNLVTVFNSPGLAKTGFSLICHLWGRAQIPPDEERLLFQAIQEVTAGQ